MGLARLGAIAVLALVLGSAPARAQNYSDLWWNPLESGWGLAIADHDTDLVAVWFTYGPDGQPTWFVCPGGTFSADRRLFQCSLYETRGPPYASQPFDPARVTASRVGTASIDFRPPSLAAGIARFTYTVGEVTRTTDIQRQSFGDSTPFWGADLTDLWWNPSQSGWGLALVQHGTTTFGAWFTYGSDGRPTFFVMPALAEAGTTRLAGTLYATTGPAFTSSRFDPAAVRVAIAGSAGFTRAGTSGTLTATVDGRAFEWPVVRQAFGRSAPADPNPGGETWRLTGTAVRLADAKFPPGTVRIGLPEVVRASDGTFRLYFTRTGTGSESEIWLAESSDATAWTVRGPVLSGAADPRDAEHRIQGPSLVPLPDGRWRMYYAGTPAFDAAAGIAPRFATFSALSVDGIAFTREGARLAATEFDLGESGGHGRVIALEGRYQLYLAGSPRSGGARGIYQLRSSDGLAFSGAQLVVAGPGDPLVLKAAGGFAMYADPSKASATGATDHGLRLASPDGAAWGPASQIVFLDGYGARLSLGTAGLGDFAAAAPAAGKLRLFSRHDSGDLVFHDRTFLPNLDSTPVTVIQGDTNATTSVAAGAGPIALAANPLDGAIYVANSLGDDVTRIQGATLAATTIRAGSRPRAIAVDSTANQVYVANYNANSVTLIDGATGSTATVATGFSPIAVAVNPATHRAFVANFGSNDVTVIDGLDRSTRTVGVGASPYAIAVNSVTNRVYVANYGSDSVTVIDGTTLATTAIPTGRGPSVVAVDAVANRIYVANLVEGTVTVIDGTDHGTATVATGGSPHAIGVNAATGRAYVANYRGDSVSVIDAGGRLLATIPSSSRPRAIAVNAATNRIYVVNEGSGRVSVIDGATHATTSIPAGAIPFAIAIDETSNRIFVASQNLPDLKSASAGP